MFAVISRDGFGPDRVTLEKSNLKSYEEAANWIHKMYPDAKEKNQYFVSINADKEFVIQEEPDGSN